MCIRDSGSSAHSLGVLTLPRATMSARRAGLPRIGTLFCAFRTCLMITLGTPLSPSATRVLLLGSGELGKEVAIELQRFGVEVIAADRYANAPAMQVAHRSHVLDMLDPAALKALIAQEQPHLVVPEIEAIHTETLVQLEAEQRLRVIPTARAARLTMDLSLIHI